MTKIRINENSNIITGITPFSSDAEWNIKDFISIKRRVFLDCTFGGGGYSKAILKFPNTKVIAFDRDIQVFHEAKNLKINI